MTKTHLVTDRQAEKMRELSSRPGGSAWVVDLLATRTVAIEFVEALHKHVKEVHFLTCPWCYQIVEKGDVFLAGLHGDSTSGTSAPPETEQP